MEKKGSIYMTTNYAYGEKFMVNPRWVSMWHWRGKISYQNARALYIVAGANCQMNIKNMDAWLEAAREKNMDDYHATVLAWLEDKRCVSIDPPGMNVWRDQYNAMRQRTKPCILTGPSQVGKTMYALHIFGNRELMTLLNVQMGMLPDLSQFRWGEHKGIVIDEGTPDLVVHNKRVFQGLPEMVYVNGSATHCHARKVYLHNVPIIVTCNDWWERYDNLPPVDQAWLDDNTFVFDCETLMYNPRKFVHPQPE